MSGNRATIGVELDVFHRRAEHTAAGFDGDHPIGSLHTMSEPEPVMQHAWVVRTARDEDFYYRGPLPEIDEIIEVKSGGGVLVNVRVTRVDTADATHQIDGSEINSEIREEA